MATEKRHRLRVKPSSHDVMESQGRAYHTTSKAELHRRLDYVLACIGRPSDSRSLKLAISEVAYRRKEFPSPSVTTVCRWVHLFYVNGAPTLNGHPLLSPHKERVLRLRMIYEE